MGTLDLGDQCGRRGFLGTFDAKGFYTDDRGGSKSLASRSAVDEHAAGAYAQADLGYGPLHFIAGLRADGDSYDYSDRLVPKNDEDTSFHESTWRAGLLYHTGDWSSLFLTFSQGYSIPSVIDLFAYPGFYSNPDLVPTRADDWEAGWRYLKRRVALQGDGLRHAHAGRGRIRSH